MMPPRVWLLGESNPYQDPDDDPDHEFDLFPRPPGSAGARLCAILGHDESEYLRLYERRNLLQGPRWSAPRARESARIFRDEVCRARGGLVLCGAKVAAAFGLNFKLHLLHPLRFVGRLCNEVDERTLSAESWRDLAAHEIPAIVVPHPSGRCLAWNDPTMEHRVRGAAALLRAAVERRATAALSEVEARPVVAPAAHVHPLPYEVHRPVVVGDVPRG